MDVAGVRLLFLNNVEHQRAVLGDRHAMCDMSTNRHRHSCFVGWNTYHLFLCRSCDAEAACRIESTQHLMHTEERTGIAYQCNMASKHASW